MKNEKDCSLDSCLKEVKDTLDQLKNIDFSIPHELVVIMILNSFSTHYNIFVKTLASKDSLPMLEELEPQLLNEKLQIKLDVDKEISTNVSAIKGRM
jgi:hypothetical protein